MSEATIDALLEQVAALEQKAANRDLLLERIMIWLRNREGEEERDFLYGIEKHLAIVREVEGSSESKVHLQEGIELQDKP